MVPGAHAVGSGENRLPRVGLVRRYCLSPMIETFADGKVRSWASILDDVTRAQAAETASLSIISAPIALMPDAHLGAGATIGTVLVTENALIPMAVGIDIGCGMAARKLQLKLDEFRDTGASAWVREMQRTVPAGLGNWHGKASQAALDWIDENPPSSRLENVPRAAEQLGTLGSGNHFVELSIDEDGHIWLLLHSGSRGAGNKLAQIHGKVANTFTGTVAPNRDLAWIPKETPEFDAYVDDLFWSQSYALENRRQLLASAHRAVETVFGQHIFVEDEVNCHHNYAAFESVKELGKALYVTRKGAIRAGSGDRGLIPGAMGQASFVVTGLGNPASYRSCSHGAGRAMSRTRSQGDSARRVRGSHGGRRVARPVMPKRCSTRRPPSYRTWSRSCRDQADLVQADYRLRAIANFKSVESERRRR